ncbi:ATP synthase assembly factor FMC1 [Microdochium nivale]|nr:ATP synthase assembly factor FMC1 [Microdochium nivale]
MADARKLRALYRALIRELPPRPLVKTQARSPVHQRIRQGFVDDKPSAQSIAQADQMIQYLRAQRQYTILLDRYNPGMNMDQDERIRLSARRVGLNLPKEYTSDQE